MRTKARSFLGKGRILSSGAKLPTPFGNVPYKASYRPLQSPIGQNNFLAN